MATGRVEETVDLGMDENARFSYGLECAQQSPPVAVRYRPGEIAMIISVDHARRWASTEDVGLYGEIETLDGPLELAVEKDFACLDKREEENADRFPNPKQGTIC